MTLLHTPPANLPPKSLGFTVKGEVGGCDLVALNGDDPPLVVIGELKLTFNLELVLQGVEGAPACDAQPAPQSEKALTAGFRAPAAQRRSGTGRQHAHPDHDGLSAASAG